MMRLGRIGYINCYPVYAGIDRGEVQLPAELVTGTPAELNDLLVAGELDVSVISAVEYARHAKDLVLLPDLAISCDGPVRSVAAALGRAPRVPVPDRWKDPPPFRRAAAEATDLDHFSELPHDAVLVI